MQMYVNYYDRLMKAPEESRTVRIILCKRKNDSLVEITLPGVALSLGSDQVKLLKSRMKGENEV